MCKKINSLFFDQTLHLMNVYFSTKIAFKFIKKKLAPSDTKDKKTSLDENLKKNVLKKKTISQRRPSTVLLKKKQKSKKKPHNRSLRMAFKMSIKTRENKETDSARGGLVSLYIYVSAAPWTVGDAAQALVMWK